MDHIKTIVNGNNIIIDLHRSTYPKIALVECKCDEHSSGCGCDSGSSKILRKACNLLKKKLKVFLSARDLVRDFVAEALFDVLLTCR